MSAIRPRPVFTSHAPAPGRRTASFGERLYEALRSTPWWLASVGAHVVLGLVVAALGGTAPAAPPRVGVAILPYDALPPPDDPVPPAVPEFPPVTACPMLPSEPVPRPDDRSPAETPDDSDAHETRDNGMDEPGDAAWDGASRESILGIGPGGGSPGGNGLGGRAWRRGNGRGEIGGAEQATDLALRWLAAHQSPDGRWNCSGFECMCKRNRCGGAGGPLHDPGVTGLALLAFLGTGETHKTPKFGPVVRAGLKYLKGIQDAEGCFGPRTSGHFVYDHAIAAMAMAEAYGMTRSPLFKASAQPGIDFVHRSQNPYWAWRYGVRPQDNDTSVTGWMVMALKSAKMADLLVDPAAFEGVRAWLDKVTEPEYGRAGYTQRGNGPSRPQDLMDRFPADRSESLTAVAVLSRILCGADRNDEYVKKGTDLCLKVLPSWDEAAGTVDHYYWYYGSLAMYQVGGEPWKRWAATLKKALVDRQHQDPADDRLGSWDPADPWGSEGGRVYATAINALTLEVYYRYPLTFGVKR